MKKLIFSLFLAVFCLNLNAQYDSTNVDFSVYFSPLEEEYIESSEADTLSHILSAVELPLFEYFALISIDDTLSCQSFEVNFLEDNTIISSLVIDYDPIDDFFECYERFENHIVLRMGQFELLEEFQCEMIITDTSNAVTSPFIYESEEP